MPDFDALLAPYAMHSADSAGRLHPEEDHPYRSPYQRDRDRVVHSSAFRRLAHKTQVFTGDMGDYHRSRLTHTLEVASVARTVGRALRLNEDLIEALALVHDVGHPPFGHAGEGVLDKCLADVGGFNHNRQALRVVTLLETRYPEFPGLNLTAEVLSGQEARADKAGPMPLLEVQLVDAADSIAYDAHDADDAFELGLLPLEELECVELWATAASHVRRRRPGVEGKRLRRSIVHELIDMLVSDLLAVSTALLAESAPADAAAAMSAGRRLIAPSDEIAAKKKELESFLFKRVYRHPRVLDERERAGLALREMFAYYAARPAELPVKFQAIAARDGVARATGDYLAGMTDRFALEQHALLA